MKALEFLIGAIEARDPYTSGHSRRVASSAATIARIVGLGDGEATAIGAAGLVHDVGKTLEKYYEVLRKPHRLTGAEWALIKEHAADGEAVLRVTTESAFLPPAALLLPAVRHHHERWDGRGYPDGIAGEAIPVWSRIIALADTIDAMTSTRPYRRGLTPAEVRVELARCAGTQFDPAITAQLLASPVWSALVAPLPTTAPPLARPEPLRRPA